MSVVSPILSKEEKERFLSSALSKIGCLYCWPCAENNYSGKGLSGAKYHGVYDCSGLVTSSLCEATAGRIDKRREWNAKKLMENCAAVERPIPGDLCFYGPSYDIVTHVAIYVGACVRGGSVLSASGGNSTITTPEKAAEAGAKVMLHRSPKYRRDFLCFGRLVTAD